MSLSTRRVRAIARKDLREYRRNPSIVAGMAILPLIFIIQPLVTVVALSASASSPLAREHVLVYLLGIPALVPGVIAGYAVAGERQQGTLEPALTTPIRADELLLGKALAALLPSVVIAYAVFAVYIGAVVVLAQPTVATALIQWPDVVAQVLFTPLLAGWTIWVSIAMSTRTSDVRVAQQLSILASLPSVFVVVLIAFDVIHATLGLAIGGAALLAVLNGLGWRIASRMFDRERLVTGTRA
jgi:ABC-type transport system involved in multi-copper enzyme maturation permease subunit